VREGEEERDRSCRKGHTVFRGRYDYHQPLLIAIDPLIHQTVDCRARGKGDLKKCRRIRMRRRRQRHYGEHEHRFSSVSLGG